MIHTLIAKHYMYGGYYPIGGASRMAETIIPKFKTGGEVLLMLPLNAFCSKTVKQLVWQ